MINIACFKLVRTAFSICPKRKEKKMTDADEEAHDTPSSEELL